MITFKNVITICTILNDNIDSLNFNFEFKPVYNDIDFIIYDYLDSFILENIKILKNTELKTWNIDDILKVFFEIILTLKNDNDDDEPINKSVNDIINIIHSFIKNVSNNFSEEEIDNMFMKVYKDFNYYNILLSKEFKKAYKIYKKGVKDYYDKEIEDKLFKLYISASENGSFDGSFQEYKRKHKISNMTQSEKNKMAKRINEKFSRGNKNIKQVYKVG
jgi:hypothetical protein